MRKFVHTVTSDDTSSSVGSGDLDVLATPRLITWCENAAFQVCQQQIDADHTTVGTTIKMEHVRGSAVGTDEGSWADAIVAAADEVLAGRHDGRGGPADAG